MSLKLLKDSLTLSPETPEEKKLSDFCHQHNLDITFEWIDGQYWLHSDLKKERPITIEIDKELKRHEEYFRRSSLQKELLARAIGVKGSVRPKVVDLTAGLLGDTLLFLSFGCEVVSLERNPIVAFLIQSALKNAQHPALSRFQFLDQDAESFLSRPVETDVLYFDPMFEDANEKASPRKEMRIFRSLIGGDADAVEIFEKAKKLAVKRLVVKRPRLSVPLDQSSPVVFEGKATRYDVYLGQNSRPIVQNPLK